MTRNTHDRQTARSMPPGRGAALLLALAALVGCSNDLQQAAPMGATPRFAAAPGRPEQLPAGVGYRCAPGPDVTERAVTPGTEGDANQNGIVCDTRMGVPRPRGNAPAARNLPPSPVLVADDVAMPLPGANGNGR